MSIFINIGVCNKGKYRPKKNQRQNKNEFFIVLL